MTIWIYGWDDFPKMQNNVTNLRKMKTRNRLKPFTKLIQTLKYSYKKKKSRRTVLGWRRVLKTQEVEKSKLWIQFQCWNRCNDSKENINWSQNTHTHTDVCTHCMNNIKNMYLENTLWLNLEETSSLSHINRLKENTCYFNNSRKPFIKI